MAHSANGSQCTSEERRPPHRQLGLRIRRWREPRGPGVPHRSDRAREDPGGHRQVLSAGRDRRGTQVSRAGTQEGACGRFRELGVNRAEPASLGGTTRRRTGSNWLTQRVCSTRDTLPLIGVSERFVGDGRLRLSGLRNDARSSATGSVVGLHHTLRLLVDLQMCSQRMTTNWLGGQRFSTEGFGPR